MALYLNRYGKDLKEWFKENIPAEDALASDDATYDSDALNEDLGKLLVRYLFETEQFPLDDWAANCEMEENPSPELLLSEEFFNIFSQSAFNFISTSLTNLLYDELCYVYYPDAKTGGEVEQAHANHLYNLKYKKTA